MKTFDFQRAVPIWAKEREREMNCELAFRAAISGAEADMLADDWEIVE